MRKYILFLIIVMSLILTSGIYSASYSKNRVPEGYILEKYTSNSETKCIENKCKTTIYSGTRNVFEDGIWKRIENARSLRNTNIKCIIISDGNNLVECNEYNFTSIKLSLRVRNITFSNSPIRLYNRDGLKSTINLIGLREEESKEISINYKLGDIIHFGEQSTIITLQDADTENLDDVSMREANPTTNYNAEDTLEILKDDTAGYDRWGSIKFKITDIPETATVIWLNLSLYLDLNNLDSLETFKIGLHYLENKTWLEEIQTWNNKPLDYNATNMTNLNVDATSPINTWYSWITNKTGQITTYNNLSFYLIPNFTASGIGSSDQVEFRSKEHITITTRPILEIEYITQCEYLGYGNWEIDSYCEYENEVFNIDGNLSINDGGTMNMTNVTLNFTSTNQYITFENVADTQNKFILDNSTIN